MNSAEEQIYRFADVEVNTSQNCLKRDGSELHLRQKAFFVLVHLLEQNQRVVSKDELMKIVWKDTAVTDDALVQCITEIRRSIGDDSHAPRFIKTVPKTGYRFIGQLENHENGFHQNGAELSFKNKKTHPSFPLFRSISNKKLFSGILILLITVSLLIFSGQSAWQNRQTVADISLPQIDGKKSLAVMYFENQTGSAELDWMREGLADMLITNLSRSSSINVLSRQQFHRLLEGISFLQNGKVSFEQTINLARKCQAQNFITGSFAKAGEKIRIDAQLHDTNSGSLLAAESLVIENPEQILTEIDLLSMKLAKHFSEDEPAARINLADVMTDNLEAYRYYSLAVEKAQALHNKEAIELLEKSIALDPQFAMAHARIGYAYAVTWGITDKGKPHLEKAFRLSNRLSEKDRLNIKAWYEIANLDYPSAIQTYREIIAEFPLEAEGYWRLGRLYAGEEQMSEAVEVLKQGLTVDPDGKDIYNTLGGIYSELGKHTEAIAARQRYVALAPAEANAYDSLGLAYQWAGDYQTAIVNYNRALELNPNFEIALVHLANTRFQLGQYDEAVNLYTRYIEIAPSIYEQGRGWDAIAQIHLKKRDFASAGKAAGELLKLKPRSDWSPYLIASESGNLKKAAEIEELVFLKFNFSDRGARIKQRFDFYKRGYVALQKGLADEAIVYFREAVRHKPPIWNFDAYEDCLANAFLKTGKLDEAIVEYRRILRLNPNYPLARFQLAQALEKKGLVAEARLAYQDFLNGWKDADADIPEVIYAANYLKP